ncbi:4-(cytidine 5'-diphospho)-2-C-methyl-D-erythritol kinase [Peptacetobacter hominis]|uniref:4-(cytidine 5'-diphospho)-2-C-methyl-D-erythritol kinase n=1 Tax=Peptacetobacter hominis TaxID=2743610 RepID=UPI0015822009|nr:4-(cytidine 5'-diphospho)-2-C-methyl-D-erythritol kinase [Peptacetobacter hominis]
MKVKCRAKINISIDVLGRLENGYHLVEMIMQSIDLYDIINVEKRNDGKICLYSESDEIPLDEGNIVYKAASKLKQRYKVSDGADIKIEKNIPVAAGMAGGSTDAAGVIKALNIVWNLNLSENDMKEIGFEIGADVPFCISGGSSLAENLGEKLTQIKGLPEGTNILVCKPDIYVSTAEVYKHIDSEEIQKRPDTEMLIEYLKQEDIKAVAENMYNVLELVTEKMHPEIKEIENVMYSNDALGAMMSGSGPTVFGIFEDKNDALRAENELKRKYRQVYLVSSSERGIEIDG